jgi:ABC-type transport system involved in cytochrome c biogenesis permease subunit
MNKTVTEPTADRAAEQAYVADPPPSTLLETLKPVLRPLASLQLTVVLFALALLLVFFGTLAQMNDGIWTVVDKYFRSAVVWVPFELLAKFSNIFFTAHSEVHWKGSFPFPGGWLLGSVMLVNLLAAHMMRFRMTWKRSGIFVLHGGVILLMIGELVTGLYAVESTMTLTVGESTNFVDETQSVELVISKPISPEIDDVVKVPGSRLKKRGLISDPELPVDIEVLEYWRNSDIKFEQGSPRNEWWLDAGDGVRVIAIERPEEAGVDPNQKGDAPAVRLNLRKKGTDESVGKFLLSLWYYPNSTMNSRQVTLPPLKFTADGQEYAITLRNKRAYKPYTIHLKKFEHAKYQGTDIPKDFASTVELTDPEENTDREARIWMNHPLRYRESSFYQLSVLRGDGGTVLQVVRNPGRIIPYIACSMVAGGLLLHFGILLIGFLRRDSRNRITAGKVATFFGIAPIFGAPWAAILVLLWGRSRRGRDNPDDPFRAHSLYVWFVPFLVVLLATGWILSKAMIPTAKPDQIDYFEAGKIPVLQNGRIKPLDTVARTTLQAISGRTEVQDENRKVVASATQWYIDVFDSHDPFSGKAADYKVFRIDNDQVLSLLELKDRPEFFRYSLKEIKPRYGVFEAELKKVQAKKGKKLDLRDTKILDLGKKLHLYEVLCRGTEPHLVPPQSEGQEWLAMETIDEAVDFTDEEKDAALDEARRLILRVLEEQGKAIEDLTPEELRRAQQMMRILPQKILVDQAPDHRDRVNPAAAAFTKLMRHGKAGDAQAFNDSLKSYRENFLGRVSEEEWKHIRYEAFFNNFSPFIICSYLYIFVIILAVLGWLVWRDPLICSALWLGVLTFALHTFALGMRMYLQDRPPVTNLYSSAVFIGWGAVLLCLVMEGYFRNGIGSIVGGTLGALTMMVAHFLSEGGDTMEMLQAVLDTNFWLATHVTCVTLGYVATFVAGFIALLYVLMGIFTTAVKDDVRKSFTQMLYGTICFATFLSFTGTVLGGIWADYSWGRFWGWDAKENGAVMVVIWNTLILHARWAGLVKMRGIAILALVGNMITVWSWFGTNQLQAGLHSYGFSTELAERCKWVWLVSLVFIALALLPQKYWRSYSETAAPESKRPPRAVTTRK